eukprot:4741624-Amphidinium_carterae.1
MSKSSSVQSSHANSVQSSTVAIRLSAVHYCNQAHSVQSSTIAISLSAVQHYCNKAQCSLALESPALLPSLSKSDADVKQH